MWLPGTFGSLAAAPQTPGLSAALIYYHTSVRAGGDIAFVRHARRLTTNTGNLDVRLEADADLGFINGSYVLASPFPGDQAAFSVLVPVGRNTARVDATLTRAIGPVGFVMGGSRTDSVSGTAILTCSLPCAGTWRPQLDDLRHG